MSTSSLIVFLILGTCSSLATAKDSQSHEVQFGNSWDAEVQADFNEAITLLHSFEYPETSNRFQNIIIERDPGCAMAYWGKAMSLWHPLWAPRSGL